MATAKMAITEDMFEAAHRAFFAAGESANAAALPKARETTFAKEIPAAAGVRATSTPTSAGASAQKDTAVLVAV